MIRALLFTTALIAPSAALADPISIGIAAAASAFSAAAAGTGAAIASGATFAAAVGGLNLAAIAVSAAVGGVLAGVSQALAGSQKPGTPPPNTSIRQSSPVLPLVYGECRVGGYARIYHANEAPDFIGKSLETVWVLAADEIEDVLAIYDGDKVMWTKAGGVQPDYIRSNGNPRLSVEVRLGAVDDETPTALKSRLPDTLDTDALADFEAHVAGKPYVYITFWSVGPSWPKGLPSSMWFKVRGHKVYDPRDETTDYSNNLVLCAADYLKRQGGSVYEYIDDTQLIAAANLCDELVTMLDGVTNQPRYTLNGAISTDAEPRATLVQIMAHAAGQAVWTGEKLLLMPGAYSTPVASFGIDDYLTPLRIRAETLIEDHLESVSGTFSSSANGYRSTEYPEITLDDAGEGDPRRLPMDLPWITNDERAQRVGLISLRQTRRLKRVSFSVPLNSANAGLMTGDRITVALDPIGLSGVFEIVERKSVYDPNAPRVEIEAIEDAVTFWSWSADTATVAPISLSSNLQDPSFVQPPSNVVATAQRRVEADGTTTRWLLVEWDASPDPYLGDYEVEWTSEGEWDATAATWGGAPITWGDDPTFAVRSSRTRATRHNILSLPGETVVSIRVRAINTLGVESQWVTAGDDVRAAPDTTSPPAPSSVKATAEVGYATISVTAEKPSDWKAYHVRTADPGAAFSTVSGVSPLVIVSDTFPIPIAYGAPKRVYVQSVDFTGNASAAVGVEASSRLITEDELGAQIVGTAALAQQLKPPVIVTDATLPTAFVADLIYWAPENVIEGAQLYRWTGAAYVGAVDAATLQGEVAADQITADSAFFGAVRAAALAAEQADLEEVHAELLAARKVLASEMQVASLDAISANLGAITVGSANIEDASITTLKIAGLAVDTGRLANSAVTESINVESATDYETFSDTLETLVSYAVPAGVAIIPKIQAAWKSTVTNDDGAEIRIAIGSTELFSGIVAVSDPDGSVFLDQSFENLLITIPAATTLVFQARKTTDAIAGREIVLDRHEVQIVVLKK